jgi:hypothetical protein
MRPRDVLLIVGRLGCATATVVAMTYQFATLDATLPTFSAGNFFSFFTIQSNILAALLLAATAVVRHAERTALFDAVRGAVTLYITITGVVFALLLSGHQESLDTHIAWVNFVVHKLIPVACLADWLIDPPRHRLPMRTAVIWLAYPLAWFVYTLGRGPSANWYPYPFVDVDKLGYGDVLWRAAILAVAFLGAAAAFVAIGNLRCSRATPATAPA